jgi:hypothetical protein
MKQKQIQNIYKTNRLLLIDSIIDQYGYMKCQYCNITNAFKFHCHHIYFRSEKPNHINLHHIDNLIIVCDTCHDYLHACKHKARKELIDKRNLTELFK